MMAAWEPAEVRSDTDDVEDALLEAGSTDRAGDQARQLRPGRLQQLRSAGIIGVGLFVVTLLAFVAFGAEEHSTADRRGGARPGAGALELVSVVKKRPECQEAPKGSQCLKDIEYAMHHIKAHPDWYVGLDEKSDLKAFQAFLHKQRTKGGLRRCPKPCGHVERINQHLYSSKCHTALKGEDCYNHVIYTKKENLPKHPEWYPGLPAHSSFQVIQDYLHNQHVCPKPCGLSEARKKDRKAECMEKHGRARRLCLEEQDEDSTCHTAVPGEPCYGDILWARDYQKQHPEFYNGVDENSTFEEFQALLHLQKNEDATKRCPNPCNKKAVDRLDDVDMRHCNTASPGESCYKSVAWVIEDGIKKHPAWYENITEESSFEEVQARLVKDKQPACRRHPCPCETATKGDACYNSVKWVMTSGLANHSSWYKDLNENSTFEEVQLRLHRDHKTHCKLPCRRPPWARAAAEAAAGE